MKFKYFFASSLNFLNLRKFRDCFRKLYMDIFHSILNNKFERLDSYKLLGTCEEMIW
jgi:hypothetical protein